MQLQRIGLFLLALVVSAVGVAAQDNAFLGKWNITGDPPNEGHVYWLDVKNDGGALSAMFLNRGGSPVPATDVKMANGELSFTLPGTGAATTSIVLRAAGGKLTGTVGAADNSVKVTGVRPPQWAACDANASHTFGKPVALFDGTSMTPWGVQFKDKPSNWAIEDGTMTNTPPANNLVSTERFKDFKLEAEYKLSPKGNSGIYLRGRYEMQVLTMRGRHRKRMATWRSTRGARRTSTPASRPANGRPSRSRSSAIASPPCSTARPCTTTPASRALPAERSTPRRPSPVRS